MERDWYRRLMMKLADAREVSPGEYVALLDSELDDLAMKLDGFRRRGSITSLTLKKGLNLLSELRSRLELAQSGPAVRHIFLESNQLQVLVDEVVEVSDDRGEIGE